MKEAAAAVLDRGLPAAVEAEQVVLGAMCQDGNTAIRLANALTGSDFSLHHHRILFGLLPDIAAELAGMGLEMDLGVVAEMLMARGQLDSVGGFSVLGDLFRTPKLKVDGYIERLREKEALRRLIALGQKVALQAADGASSAKEIVGNLSESLYQDFQSRAFGGGLVETGKFIETYPGGAEAFNSPWVSGSAIKTGYAGIDRMAGGIRKGEIWMFYARPSMGKTSMMLNLLRNIARQGYRVAVFSLEMETQDLLYNLNSNETQIGHRRFRDGELGEDERERWAEGMERIMSWPIHWDRCPGTTVPMLSAKLKQLHMERPVDLFCIDYVQLLRVKTAQNKSENDRFTEIGDGLQLLSSTTGIPALLLSQLTREGERFGQRDKRPHLHQMRGSGKWEEIINVGFGLYREEKYQPSNVDVRGLAEAICEKNRGGETGVVKMRFKGWCYGFEDTDESQ